MKKTRTIVIVFMLFISCIATIIRILMRDETKKITLSSPSEAMNALEFWAEQRAYPHDVIPDQGYFRAYEESYRKRAKGNHTRYSQDRWTCIGPVNRGGRTIALAVDPQNPNVIYAGSASGGLWRLTMNGGFYSWERIEMGFPVLGVNAIAIDPTDSDVIYIGTGEVYGYQNSNGGLYERTTRGSYGIGLLKTTNRGITWMKSIDWSYSQQRGVLCIRLHPHEPQTIFAGTTEGTYKSTDAGQTWNNVHPQPMAVDIAINPQESYIVCVSCGNLGSPGSGVYRSMDSGEPGTWHKLRGGLPSGWTGKTMLAVYRSSPNIIYADIADTYRTVGLYCSTDYGDTWTVVTRHDYALYQGWFAHYVRVDPTNNANIICAGVQFYTSTDGGATLEIKQGMHVDHHAYANHPTDPQIVYFANDGGVYRTDNGGLSYQELNNGYITSQFYNGFSSSVTDSTLALGGLQDNGTIMYAGNPSWLNWILGGDGCFTAINSQDEQIIYASMQGLDIYRSTRGGIDWDNISQSFTHRNVCFVAPFLLSPSHPWVLYAGEDFIYRSEDTGTTWIAQNGGRPLNGNPIIAIAVSHTDPDVVYAATVPGSYRRAELFASTDAGATWENITGELPDRYYVDLHVSPHDDRILYVALSGFGSSHLYSTRDGGQTWTDIGNGLPDVPTSAVISDPRRPHHIFVGNDLGVYISTDDGSTWAAFQEGMPTAALVMDLSISPSNQKLRAVTHGNGVYERSLLVSTPVDKEAKHRTPVAFELRQNFPNPFNPSTTIAFILPHPCLATLTIYNTLGREIRTLAANGYTAGTFSVTWDGKDRHGCPVPGGTYLYRLVAGDYIQTKKMTLIR